MDEDRERNMAMAEIKDEIAQGKYRVDVQAVADAILRQLRLVAPDRAEHRTGHESCVRTLGPFSPPHTS